MLAKGEDVRITSYLITFQIRCPHFHSFLVIYMGYRMERELKTLLCNSKKQHMIAKPKKLLQLSFTGWRSPYYDVSEASYVPPLV